MSLIQNPIYTTEAGDALPLQPIAPLVFQAWQSQWKKRHPEPKPPLREVMIVNKPYAEPNINDAYYKKLVAEWNEEFSQAQLVYILSRGVTVAPPSDWEPDPETVSLDATDMEKKALWIMGKLTGAEDFVNLQEAVLSLMGVTSEAVEEAEKNSV